jgi:hypothetical protein
MSKKKKRIIKHKQIKKPIIKEVELVTNQIKPTKRKYHKKRAYVRKQPMVSVVITEPPIIGKQIPIQFDIIPKKLMYGIIIAMVAMVISTTVIMLNIPPEPMTVTSDGSYLAVGVR